MITLNTKFLNTVCLATEQKNNSWGYKKGIYIEDRENKRLYTACDGHILIRATEDVIDEPLQAPLLIEFNKPIKTILSRFELIINKDFITLKGEKKPESFNLIDFSVPEYDRIINETSPEATEFCMFEPEYLKIVKTVFEGKYPEKYQMENKTSPCLMTSKNSDFQVVLMPTRVWSRGGYPSPFGSKKMDKISLSLIIDKLTEISDQLYNGKPDRVLISFELDKVIDDLNDWLKYLPLAPKE